MLSVLSRRAYLARVSLFYFFSTCLIFIALFILLELIPFQDFDCDVTNLSILQHTCDAFEKKNIDGHLCVPLCNGHFELINCPSSTNHDGKQHVLIGKLFNQSVVLKQREFLIPPNITHVSHEQLKHYFKSSIDSFFGYKNHSFMLSQLQPFQPIANQTDDEITFTNAQLQSLYLLVQENEYIISKIFNESPITSHLQLFPPIIATCGQLFAVKHIPKILNKMYIVPNGQGSSRDKVQIAWMIINFIIKLELTNLNLQICDLKLEHFGVLKSKKEEFVQFIDGDLIYHQQTLAENINAIDDCKEDKDCDYVQCEGICTNKNGKNSCSPSLQDSNLQRVCKHLLFHYPENNSKIDTLELGLLVKLENHINNHVQKIFNICFKNNKSTSEISEKDFNGKNEMNNAQEIKKELVKIMQIMDT